MSGCGCCRRGMMLRNKSSSEQEPMQSQRKPSRELRPPWQRHQALLASPIEGSTSSSLTSASKSAHRVVIASEASR